MKKTPLFTFTLLILFTLFSHNTFAQDPSQWHLPEGVKARLSKGSANEIQYSPDGTRLAVAGGLGIWLYDTATHQEVALLTGHTGLVYSVVFSPDGDTFASGSHDNTVRLWDAKTGQHNATLTGHTTWVESVAFSPDGDTIASGSYGEIRLWAARTGQQKTTITGHTSNVWSLAFSPDGDTLASGSSDRTVRLWDARTGQHKDTLTGAYEARSIVLRSVPMVPRLQVGVHDSTVRLWDTRHGAGESHAHGAYGLGQWSVAFSPNGETLASGSYGRRCGCGMPDTGQHKDTITWHTVAMSGVSRSVPMVQTLASGSWKEVRLWDAKTGQHKDTITGHAGLV